MIAGINNKRKVHNVISIMIIVIFVLSLIPILYLARYDVATGDDYGYGTLTHIAWMNSHSLVEVFKAICTQIRQSYNGWQGTWFTIALFTLQPEVFCDGTYQLVPFIVIGMQAFAVLFFTHRFVRKKLKCDKMTRLSVSAILLFIFIQFVPSTQAGIYWWVGTAHYMPSFDMALICIALADDYLESHKIRGLIVLVIMQLLLGGGSYQAAILTPLSIIVLIITRVVNGRRIDKKDLFLAVPFIAEMVSLIISAAAPGNKVRAGEDFGFSIGRAFGTIVQSFEESFSDMLKLFGSSALVLGLIVAMCVILVVGIYFVVYSENSELNGFSVRFPGLFILMMICLNAASHAPALYAAVGVSGGVGNTNFYMMVLTITASIVYLGLWVVQRIKNSKDSSTSSLVDGNRIVLLILSDKGRKIISAFFVLCLLCLCFIGRHGIKSMTVIECIDYISSGQAADYGEQMKLQKEILSDESDLNPVVPMINNEQGPLQQMPVTDDPDAWSNRVTAEFYGKETVIGIVRTEWEEKIK